MHLPSVGLLLVLCTFRATRANEYDPYEPLVAEASQHDSQYAAVATFNTVSDGRPQQQQYQAVSSFGGNTDAKSFGGNNGQVSQFASGGKSNYWWMNAPDSPFKRAEQAPLPCSTSDGCTASSHNIQVQQPLDLSQNPFLGGNYVAAAPQQQYYQDSQHVHSAGCGHAATRYNANPIYPARVNPQAVVPVASVASYNQIEGGNGFASKSQYASPRESGSQFISVAESNARSSCHEQGRICAPRSLCQNGLVRSDQLSLLDDSRSECEGGEVCCKIYYDANPGRPFASQSQVRCRSGNQKCVQAYHCVNGELTSEGLKYAARIAPSQTCQSPKVCCGEARVFDSAPAAANSNPLTPEGYVITVPDRRYLPSVPEPEQPDRVGAPDTPNESKLSLPTQPPPAPVVVSTTYLPPTTVRTIPTRPVTPRVPERVISTRPPTPVQYEQQPANVNPAILSFPTSCPAAMNCTRKEFCTAGAEISKSVVTLTPDQELYRVPMTQCKIPGTGEEGFCCRDTEYVDPWPKGVLGQYRPDLLGFDDGSYKPENGARIKAAASQLRPQKVRPGTPLRAAASAPQNSILPAPVSQPTCGTRDRTFTPQAPTEINTSFGEIPWQVMVLRESTKTLLCGGAIVGPNTVVLTAKCVQGLRVNDILVKTGEWQLGTEVEPKGTKIVRTKSVQAHPQFNPQTLEYNIAIITLFEPVTFDVHVAPICLDDIESDQLNNCIVTGWGKEVLKVHAQDAIMQYADVYPMSNDQCSVYVPQFNPSSSYCGQTRIDGCLVDSGSALACQGPGGKYVLKGVYSTENECNSQSQVISFTKIDTNWVKSALNGRGRQVAAAATPQEVRVKPPSSYLPPN